MSAETEIYKLVDRYDELMQELAQCSGPIDPMEIRLLQDKIDTTVRSIIKLLRIRRGNM